jgi:DNA-directed RNA polymerase specialized sigma24 family protein
MLVLAHRLRSKPDLDVDPEQIEEKFCAWIGTIVANACFHAYRRIRRLHRESGLPPDYDMLSPEDVDLLEQWVDVSLAVEKLDPATQITLRLFGEGYIVADIAEALDLSYFAAYRRLQRGLCKLRLQLEPDESAQSNLEDEKPIRIPRADCDDTRRSESRCGPSSSS